MDARNLLQAVQKAGVGRFVIISTVKAVNPTSVMGASKRVAEFLVHRAAQQGGQVRDKNSTQNSEAIQRPLGALRLDPAIGG